MCWNLPPCFLHGDCTELISSEGEFRSVFNLTLCSHLSLLAGINVTIFLRVLKYNAGLVPQGIPLLKCSSLSYQKITLIHLPVGAGAKKGFSLSIIAASLFTLLLYLLSLEVASKSWEPGVRETVLALTGPSCCCLVCKACFCCNCTLKGFWWFIYSCPGVIHS